MAVTAYEVRRSTVTVADMVRDCSLLPDECFATFDARCGRTTAKMPPPACIHHLSAGPRHERSELMKSAFLEAMRRAGAAVSTEQLPNRDATTSWYLPVALGGSRDCLRDGLRPEECHEWWRRAQPATGDPDLVAWLEAALGVRLSGARVDVSPKVGLAVGAHCHIGDRGFQSCGVFLIDGTVYVNINKDAPGTAKRRAALFASLRCRNPDLPLVERAVSIQIDTWRVHTWSLAPWGRDARLELAARLHAEVQHTKM